MKKKVLVLLGGEFHDFQKCGKILKDFLEFKFEVELTDDRNMLASSKLKSKNVCLFYTQGGKLTQEQEKGLLAFVKNGGGFVGIHCASDSFRENKGYINMIGGIFINHGQFCEFPVNICRSDSLITKRLSDFTVLDELYILKYDLSVQVLATSMWQGKSEPMVYLKDYYRGKVCYIALGHGVESFLNPSFQKIVTRAIDGVSGFREGKPINCAVIGYGGAFNMGKYHLEFINAIDGLKGIAVCDVDRRRLEVAQKEFPGIKTYTDYKKLLNDKEVGLITIITPHNTHAPIAIDCLNAGKNVVVEKPMCITLKEATEMIQSAKKNKLMLSVFHNRRWDGDYLAIEEIIKKGLIGDIFHIEVFIGGYNHPGFWWRSNKKISGGPFYDWGSHLIYWVMGLVPDKIRNVTGFFYKKVWHNVTVEDQVEAVIRFENGVYADIQVSNIAAIGKPKWRILGEKGGIIDEWGKELFHVSTSIQGIRTEMEIKYKPTLWKEYYVNIADHLIFGEPLEITPESARKVIGVIESAQRSSNSGKAEAVTI